MVHVTALAMLQIERVNVAAQLLKMNAVYVMVMVLLMVLVTVMET